MVTEVIIVHCEHKQISLNDLHVHCSPIGGDHYSAAQKYTILTKKLRTPSLQQLSIQHNLDMDSKQDVDSMKTAVADHIASGGCQA